MGGRPAVSVIAPARVRVRVGLMLRPAHQAFTITAVTTSIEKTMLLVTDIPPGLADAVAWGGMPAAEEGLTFNKAELDEAVRTDAEGEKKRPRFAGPKRDAGGSQGRVDGALAVFGLGVVLNLVALAVDAVRGDAAVRDVAGVPVLDFLCLFNRGIATAAAVAGVQGGVRHGSLTLQELPRS